MKQTIPFAFSVKDKSVLKNDAPQTRIEKR